MTVAIFLLVFAFICVFLEIFLPGGLLGGAALLLTAAASFLIYQEHGLGAAMTVFFAFFFSSAALLVIGLKYLRQLPVFRGLVLGTAKREPATGGAPAGGAQELVGKEGEALTTMAPTGTVAIDGRKYEASSQSGMIDKGMPVRVVARDAFRLVVRRVE